MSTTRCYTIEDLELALHQGDYELARHLIEDCKMALRDRPWTDHFGELGAAVNASSKETIEAQANSEKLLDLLFAAGIDIGASYNPKHKHISNGARALATTISELSWKVDPLIMTQRFNIINKLLDKKIDVNSVISISGETALHCAVRDGNKEICKLLLSRGASLTSKVASISHDTPISIAIYNNHFSLAEELLEHAIALSKEGKCNLKEAIGPSVLQLAGQTNEEQLPLLRKLIANKADVNALDHIGRNALHLLVVYGDHRNYKLTANQAQKVMSILLKAGVDTTTQDEDKLTPLAYTKKCAAMFGNTEFHQVLIKTLEFAPYNLGKTKALQSTLECRLFNPVIRIIDEFAEEYGNEKEATPAPSA